MIKHLNISVFGLVQGIFFRSTAKDEADKLGVKGFAKNMPDGSVYIETEGEKENLDKFLKWCNIGPSMTQVEKVTVSDGPLKNFKEFEIC